MPAYKNIFEGIRILDLSQYLAGPVATRLFVDLGAEVIKVELPPTGESSRLMKFARDDTPGSVFALHNRGKKCVCVDFRCSSGAAVIKDLSKEADVLIENFTPGILEKYGLDYSAIASVNPEIIMCSISTYGQDRPVANRTGNDLVALAVGGMLSMIGEPDARPMYPASAIADHMTALNAFGAVSAALFHRERTGQGQYIDLSLIDCAYNAHDWQLAAYSATNGKLDPQRGGSQRTGAFPYGVFKSKEGFIGIGIFKDSQWEALLRLIGRSDLLEIPELRKTQGRLQNQEMLTLIIEEWLAKQKDDDEAVRLLADEARLPAGRVLSVGEFARDAMLSDRIVATVKTPGGGEVLHLKSPHKFSKTPPKVESHTAALGEDTVEVLNTVCHYSDEQVDLLLKEGIVVTCS
jgi:CoA:oxalate CoA-transferase